jgi:hypothetical protein
MQTPRSSHRSIAQQPIFDVPPYAMYLRHDDCFLMKLRRADHFKRQGRNRVRTASSSVDSPPNTR